MTGQGWVAIHRQLQNSWLWTDKPFAYGQAWVDMIMLANHEEKTVLFEGELVTIQRGMFHTSILKLSERYGWDRKKTTRFINLLEKQNMVTTRRTTHGTTVSIVNYDIYQDLGATVGATSGTTHGTTVVQTRRTNNNDNNFNNDNSNINTSKDNSQNEIEEFFERMWKLYPNKKGKRAVSKKAKKEIFDLGGEKFSKAISRYEEHLSQNTWKKMQNGSTFFNGGYCDYLDENYEEGVNKNARSDSQNETGAYKSYVLFD